LAKSRIKSSTEAKRNKVLKSKIVRSKPKLPILNVAIFDGHTLWSLDYDVVEYLFKEKLEVIKLRIFLTYGYGNKFIKEDKTWQTDKAVAARIKDDVEWFNEQGIQVKLNF